MLDDNYRHAVFSDETPETRHRMQDVCDAFEKLEKELRQHIEQLQVTKWKRAVADMRPSHTNAD